MSFERLPMELLCMIVEYATDNPLRHDECQLINTFSATGENANDREFDDALKTKAAICLVNRNFNEAGSIFLYEDIRVGRRSDGLVARLEAFHKRFGEQHHPCYAFGCRVRRICLYPADEGDIAQVWGGTLHRNALRVLRRCPHVEILVRKNSASPQQWSSVNPQQPRDLRQLVIPGARYSVIPQVDLPGPALTEIFTADELSAHLSSLRRVDWTNEAYSAHTDTPRMSLPLPRFIWMLLSLEILCINGTSFPNLPPALQFMNVKTICLPELHTIRLSSRNAIGMGMHYPRTKEISLPALRRLIVGVQGAFYSAYEGCLSTQRFNITILELGCDTGFLRPGTLRSLLRFYTNVEELRIPLCTTAIDILTYSAEKFPSVRRVLYSAAMPEADSENEFLKENLWAQIFGHLTQYTNLDSAFVNIESIALVGEEWIPIVCDNRFKEMEDRIEARGLKIVKRFLEEEPGQSDLEGAAL